MNLNGLKLTFKFQKKNKKLTLKTSLWIFIAPSDLGPYNFNFPCLGHSVDKLCEGY